MHSIVAALPLANTSTLDLRVLGFSVAVALVTGLGFGLAPALSLWRVTLGDALKAGSRAATASAGQHHFRQVLIIGEVALAVVLLLGAGLLLKSFLRLRGVNPGFRPDRLLSLTVDLNRLKYKDSRAQSAYFEQLLERLRSAPGVEAIAADAMLPFTDWALSASAEIEGRELPANAHPVAVGIVNPGYFQALGIRLLQGRGLTDQDRAGAPPSIVINDCFARRYFPDGAPLGRRVKSWSDEWATIVGVVSNVSPGDLKAEPKPMVYHSYLQNGIGVMSLAIKTAGDPMKLAATVRSCISGLDPDQPGYSMMPMEQRLAQSLAPRRLNMLLLGALSGLALALAMVGIYGVVSYLVAERTQEIGVRVALGASRRAVAALVLKRGLGMTGIGLALGLAASLALARLISGQLYNVPATDPATFAWVSLALGAVALIACWIPTRRAMAVDPMVALRLE